MDVLLFAIGVVVLCVLVLVFFNEYFNRVYWRNYHEALQAKKLDYKK